ncbi:MAG TPA: hypothetical protein VFB44_18715 [Thermoleophilaceae bacterium]|nr:hypothetical protein [Thermoleophilaceae bacterium]
MAGGAPEPEDFRTFIREITRRHELATKEMIRRSQEQSAEMRGQFAEMRGQFASIRDDIRANTATLQELAGAIRVHRTEFVEEMRAQRAALFAVIDRLEGPGPATSG